MNITFLKSRLSFNGGLEKYTLQLASHFAEKGHKVTILTSGEHSSHAKLKIISLCSDSKWTLLHLCRFDYFSRQYLRNHPSEIVFGMERNRYQTHYRAGSGVHAAFLKRRFKIEPFLKKLSLLFNPLHLYLLSLEKKAFEDQNIVRLFVNSQMVRNEILTYYSVDPSKIFVVHNGVAWKERESEYKNFSNKDQIQFLFVGNGYRRKGLEFLLPVLASLKSEKFHLSVVGKDKNLSDFKNYAKRLGLEKQVTFHGHVSHLTPYYQASDVLLLPTVYDPFANVTLEALAMGLYVVTTQANGASEILTEKSGYIIKDFTDFSSMKAGVLMGLSKPKTKESAEAIRNTIKDLEFSKQLDKIVEETIQSQER